MTETVFNSWQADSLKAEQNKPKRLPMPDDGSTTNFEGE